MIVSYHSYQNTVFKTAFTEISGNFYSSVDYVFDYFDLKENNRILALENAELRNKIKDSYIVYNDKNFVVKDTTYKQQYSYVSAYVISNSVNKNNNYIWLNVGNNSGIESGMGVISPTGVVGVVKTVSNNFASVMSILHSDMKISAKLKGTNIMGSILWNGISPKIAMLEDIPANFNVAVGDTIVTTGYSLHFPEGVLIGIVEQVENSKKDDFIDVKVKLATNFYAINNVYVVVNLFKTEQNTLLNTQQSADNE
jgi:rod shape-determining protein MreC